MDSPGGNAHRLALENSDKMKLIPWGGIAFRKDFLLDFIGKAFCFLPLPTDIHFPVHSK